MILAKYPRFVGAAGHCGRVEAYLQDGRDVGRLKSALAAAMSCRMVAPVLPSLVARQPVGA
jgi:hypothetical protein